jgi:hypothetical protein
MNLPAPPQRGSFWRLGERNLNTWDIGVKLLVWGAVFVGAVYLAWMILSTS